MFDKISRIVFCTLFISMITIPLLATNLRKNKISEAENRTLTQRAEIYNEDGTLNPNFTSDFEAWINDNIGFRSQMVVMNAKIQYYLFDVLSNNSDMYLGPNGEFNYATAAMLKDYQHFNLYTEDKLQEIANSFQYINDYIESKGAKFYYYQCWDKHSIYPEYFPNTVLQYGDTSKTDAIVSALREYSSINVISPKQELIDGKEVYSTYSRWGDSTHWTQRGAYIGYLKLMEEINANSPIQYKILTEDNYNITLIDQGATLFGGIHKEDLLEKLEINEPKAVLTNEKLTAYSDDGRHRFFTNDEVDNNTRLLIIGDSYFNNFIIDDLAESFHETIIIWGDYCSDIQTIIDTYDADIVIVEAAERVDRTSGIIKGANAMQVDGN